MRSLKSKEGCRVTPWQAQFLNIFGHHPIDFKTYCMVKRLALRIPEAFKRCKFRKGTYFVDKTRGYEVTLSIEGAIPIKDLYRNHPQNPENQ